MKLIQNLLNLIYPNKCITCDSIISIDSIYCHECWHNLEFITSPKCEICSYPFEFSFDFSFKNLPNINKICLNCINKKPFYDKSIIIYRYNATIGRTIGNYKYRDRLYIAKKFGELFKKIPDINFNEYDIVCAVPLHRKKLAERKFNQSIILAKKIAPRNLKIDLILRIKNKKAQVKLTYKQRIKNTKTSFAINPKFHDFIINKKILLIDDVITTSSTINSCAKILKKAGAREISVLAIARSIK